MPELPKMPPPAPKPIEERPGIQLPVPEPPLESPSKAPKPPSTRGSVEIPSGNVDLNVDPTDISNYGKL